MNRIEEIMENYNIEGYKEMQEDANSTEKEEFTELQQRRILDLTLNKIDQDTPHKRKKGRVHMWKMACSAAVFAIFVVTSGVVIASSKEEGFWKRYLQAEDQELKNSIDNMETTVDESKSVNGYNVELKECLNDNNTVYAKFDITAPLNVTLNENQYVFESQNIHVQGGGSMGYYSSVIDDNTEDNKITIVYAIDHRTGVTDKKIAFKLKNLSYYNEEGEICTVAKGNWDFECKLKKNVETETVWQFKNFKQKERSYWITSMRLSPLSISVDIEQGISNLWKDGYLDTSQLLSGMEVKLSNGESVSIVSAGAGTKYLGTSATFLFEQAVRMDQIDSITFMGIKLKY